MSWSLRPCLIDLARFRLCLIGISLFSLLASSLLRCILPDNAEFSAKESGYWHGMIEIT